MKTKMITFPVVGLTEVFLRVKELGGDADAERWRIYDILGPDTDLARGQLEHALMDIPCFINRFLGFATTNRLHATLVAELKTLDSGTLIDLET